MSESDGAQAGVGRGPVRRARSPIIAPEGWPVIAGMAWMSAVGSLLLAYAAPAAGLAGAIIGAVLVGWGIWFFRDPTRQPALDGLGSRSAGAAISGADGVVSFVGPGQPPPELGLSPDVTAGMLRVSIFMNIFDVHVNRAPLAARVERVQYRPGKFFNAALDKASEHNERLSLVLRLQDGREAVVVQIAGLIARRIVCRVEAGAELARGERFGLIRFGSRVDHFLPAGYDLVVSMGQRVYAGVTPIAVPDAGKSAAGGGGA